MKKLIITGSNGFIGNKLVEFYKRKNIKIFAIDMLNMSSKEDSNIKHIQFDLERDDIKSLYKEINPDIFIHCAGNANVGLSVKNPEMDFDRNVGVLHKTLFALDKLKYNPKFIFLSSAAVYGNPVGLPIKEDFATIPISPYGLHKKLCEDICSYFRTTKNMNISILRIFSAYGEGLKKQLLWDMYNKYMKNGKIELFGTGNETRDFIHIIDLVNIIDLIANNDDQNIAIYNVANGIEIKIRNLANSFADIISGNNSIINFNGVTKIGDPINWKADIKKIQSIGYNPKIALDEGLRRYINWAKGLNEE